MCQFCEVPLVISADDVPKLLPWAFIDYSVLLHSPSGVPAWMVAAAAHVRPAGQAPDVAGDALGEGERYAGPRSHTDAARQIEPRLRL